MPNIINNIKGIIDQLSPDKFAKISKKELNISNVARESLKTGDPRKAEKLQHQASSLDSMEVYDEIVERLFTEVFGSAKGPELQSQGEFDPAERQATSRLNLGADDQEEIRKQITQGLQYVRTHQQQLQLEAREKNKALNVNPSRTQRLRDFIRRKKSKKRERNAQIHVESNGRFSILPKHAKLDFGKPNSTEYNTRWNQFTPQDKFEVLVKQMVHPDPEKRPSLETIEMALALISKQDISMRDFEASIDKPEQLIALFQDEQLKELSSLFFEEKQLDTRAKQQVLLQMQNAVEFINDRADDLRQQAATTNESIYLSAEKIGVGRDKEARYRGCHIQVNPDGKIYLIPKHPQLWINRGALKKLRMAVELDAENVPKRVVAFASIRSISGDFSLAQREVETINELLSYREENPVGMQIFRELGREKKSKAKVALPYANMGGISASKLSIDDKKPVMQGCIEWTEFLHDHRIVSLDIKDANFLGFRSPDGTIDIMGLDLDQAQKVDESGAVMPAGGTISYMSPELVATYLYNRHEADLPEEKKTCDGFKGDIFALGKTLLFLERRSYDSSFDFIETDPETGAPVSYDEVKYISAWNNFDPYSPIAILAKCMIHPDPTERPTMTQVSDLYRQITEEELSESDLVGQLRDSLTDLPVPEVQKEEKEEPETLNYPVLQITSEAAEKKLKKRGSWLLREDSSGNIHLHYRNQKTKARESTLLARASLEDVQELIDFMIDQGTINKKRLIKK